jgi:hypothetical protein
VVVPAYASSLFKCKKFTRKTSLGSNFVKPSRTYRIRYPPPIKMVTFEYWKNWLKETSKKRQLAENTNLGFYKYKGMTFLTANANLQK